MKTLVYLLVIFLFSTLESRRNWVIFDKANVELVEIGDHFLFRGPIPRDMENRFCYDKLINSFRQKVDLPPKFNLIIFSLLTKEREEEVSFISKLHQFFSPLTFPYLETDMKTPYIHPIRGAFYWWQVRAHLDMPMEDLKIISDQAFNGTLLEFPRLILTIDRYMNEKSTYPNVLYIHCRHGVNRTSAVLIGYEMFKYGTDLATAWELHAEGRTFYKPENIKHFLRLYSNYLDQTQTMP